MRRYNLFSPIFLFWMLKISLLIAWFTPGAVIRYNICHKIRCYRDRVLTHRDGTQTAWKLHSRGLALRDLIQRNIPFYVLYLICDFFYLSYVQTCSMPSGAWFPDIISGQKHDGSQQIWRWRLIVLAIMFHVTFFFMLEWFVLRENWQKSFPILDPWFRGRGLPFCLVFCI